MCVDVKGWNEKLLFEIMGTSLRNSGGSKNITIGTEPHACVEMESHGILFLWSLWLAAWISAAWDDDDDVVQHGGHGPANRSTKAFSLDLWYWTFLLWLIETSRNKVVHMNLGAGSRDSNHFVISYFSLITCLTVAGVRREIILIVALG